MNIIVLLLKQYWKEILLVAVLIAAVVYVVNLRNENISLNNKLTTANNNLTIEKGNNTTLRASINRQNIAIKSLKDEAVARQAKAADDLKIAQKSRNKSGQKANLILSSEPTNVNKCVAANNLINSLL